jgi:hypothetical protein
MPSTAGFGPIVVMCVYFEFDSWIRRRPNNRPSTEKAPGPKSRRDNVSPTENTVSKRPRGNADISNAICVSTDAMQAAGVNTPMHSAPTRTSKAPVSHQEGAGAAIRTTLRTSIAAAHSRRIMSPNPAAPAGNMEKSRCKAWTLAAGPALNNLKRGAGK